MNTKEFFKVIPSCIVIIAVFSVLTAQADEIPLKINVGFGLSEYRLHDIYNDSDAYITGTELSLQAVVEKETITKYKDKVPAKFRKATSKLNEVSVGHWAVPKSLFIQPDDGDKTAFGATWGIVPKISGGFKYLKFGLKGGLIMSYLYYKDLALSKDIHFIRPGLRGGVNLSVPLFDKTITFETGAQGDIYVPQTFFAHDSSWKFTSTYVMVHFRCPIKVKAGI